MFVNTKVLCAAALLSLLSWIIYSCCFAPLAKVPGPLSASYSKFWLVQHSRRGDMHRTYIDLHKRYGKVVRIGPSEVSISDPAAIKIIYGAGSKFRKSGWYGIWKGNANVNIFGETDEKIHGSHRRLMSSIYSLTSLLEMEQAIDNAIVEFIELLGVRKDPVVDLGLWLQLFAFDVIGEVTFSKRFGFMKEGKDDGTFSSIENALFSAAWIGQVPGLFWLLLSLVTFIGDHVALSASKGRLIEFAEKEIIARKKRGESGHEYTDMLGKMLKAQAEKPNLIDAELVAAIPAQNMFAGSDTTAITLRSIVYHILKNPLIKNQLLEEIGRMKELGELSNPVTFEQAKKMPFLQACISEALRIHPAVGMTLPRVVPTGGLNIQGHYLPEGTIAGVSAWVIHRDEEIFGPDTERFKPERWLSVDTREMDRCSFSFGAGSRTCIGKNISLIEISKIIPTLFSNFDVELVNPEKTWDETCRFFVMQKGLFVKIERKLSIF